MEIKRLCVPFEAKAFDEEDLYFSFSGYAATFNNVDRGGDVILPGAFTKTLSVLMEQTKEGKMPILWQHNSSVPLGVFTELKEDPHGLYVRGRMPKADTFVAGRVIPQMKAGSIEHMSIGYITVDADYEDSKRYLKEVNLIETSFVTIPMNTLAKVTDVKTKMSVTFQNLPIANRDREWNAKEAIERVKTWAEVKDKPNSKYSQAFLWFDSEKKDNFDAYKLPIADVIEGKLTVIPRGVFAAAGAIKGIRGGVDIPDLDKKSTIDHMKKYYSKMDLESPFSESAVLRIDDLSVLSVRDLEGLMREGIRTSSKTAKLLVSKVKDLLEREVQDEPKRDAENDKKDTKAWSQLLDSIKLMTPEK